jgi:hypothetical protein
VPAGSNGGVSAYVTDRTSLVLDINGYFAPSGAPESLVFYPVTPCRILDTRDAASPLSGMRTVSMRSGPCALPTAARAVSTNITVVPQAGTLAYLSAWTAGEPQPLVSTLNSFDGRVVANAAIVPIGPIGAISLFAPHSTHVIVDVNGYFAPPQ